LTIGEQDWEPTEERPTRLVEVGDGAARRFYVVSEISGEVANGAAQMIAFQADEELCRLKCREARRSIEEALYARVVEWRTETGRAKE
jgi:hypothetical protein